MMALANHRKPIRTEIAAHIAATRAREVETLTRLLGERLKDFGGTAEALSMVLTGIGRALIMEGGLGASAGHAEVIAWVERLIDDLSPANSGANSNA
jgi:hypothetical protein